MRKLRAILLLLKHEHWYVAVDDLKENRVTGTGNINRDMAQVIHDVMSDEIKGDDAVQEVEEIIA